MLLAFNFSRGILPGAAQRSALIAKLLTGLKPAGAIPAFVLCIHD